MDNADSDLDAACHNPSARNDNQSTVANYATQRSTTVKIFAIGSTTYGNLEPYLEEAESQNEDKQEEVSDDEEQENFENKADEDSDKKKPHWSQLREVLWVFGRRRVVQATRRSTAVPKDATEPKETPNDSRACEVAEDNQVERPLDVPGPFESHPEVTKTIEALWNIEDLREARSTIEGEQVLTHDPYVRLLLKFQHLIVPRPFSHAKAKINAEIDWQNDSHDQGSISYKLFHRAMYELSETWSHTESAEAFAETLERLLDGITTASSKSKTSTCHRFKPNDNIDVDLWFQDAAKELHTQHTIRIQSKEKKRRKKNKNVKCLNILHTISLIAKIYQAKLEEDKVAAENGRPCTGFDKFTHRYFTIQYGSTDLAEQNHARLVKSVHKWYKKHPRIRLFARLAGINIVPLSYESLDDSYDPMLCSNYFLPLITKLLGDTKLELVLGANNGEPIHVLMVTFQLALARICRHVPSNSLVAMRTKRRIARNRLVVQATKLAQTMTSAAVSSLHEPDHIADRTGEATEGSLTRRPTAFLMAAVSRAMEKGEMQLTVKNQSVIDLDQALLTACELWKVERQWKAVYRLVASAKAAVFWRSKALEAAGKEYNISSVLHVLSNTLVVNKAVDVGELHAVANFIATSKVVEELTGIGIDDALPFCSTSESKDPLLLWEEEFDNEMAKAKAEQAKRIAERTEQHTPPAKDHAPDASNVSNVGQASLTQGSGVTENKPQPEQEEHERANARNSTRDGPSAFQLHMEATSKENKDEVSSAIAGDNETSPEQANNATETEKQKQKVHKEQLSTPRKVLAEAKNFDLQINGTKA